MRHMKYLKRVNGDDFPVQITEKDEFFYYFILFIYFFNICGLTGYTVTSFITRPMGRYAS